MSLSTSKRLFLICVIPVFGIFWGTSNLFAQEVFIKIRKADNKNAIVSIEGEFPGKARMESRNWKFLNNYADATDITKRIGALKLFDSQGNNIKKVEAGNFVAVGETGKFNYLVNLDPPRNVTSAAHISWLNDRNGLLMLDDLLPQFGNEIGGSENRNRSP